MSQSPESCPGWNPATGSPAPQPRLGLGPLALRPTTPADCEFVVAAESRAGAAPWVEQWSVPRHRRCIASHDTAHWIIERAGTPIGYAILEGTDDPDRSLLLRRVVIASYCFEVLGFHRLWLYVAVGNRRAGNLYRRLGFVVEGIARECARHGERYTSMHVMSLLDREYAAWLAAQRRRQPRRGSTQP